RLGDPLRLAAPAAVPHRVDLARATSAREQRALVSSGHLSSVVETVGPDTDLEAGRQLDPVERNLVGRGRGRRQRNGRERRVGQLRGLALLPGWRRLLSLCERGQLERDADCCREWSQGGAPHGEPPRLRIESVVVRPARTRSRADDTSRAPGLSRPVTPEFELPRQRVLTLTGAVCSMLALRGHAV